MIERNGLRKQISEDEIDDIVIFLEAISVDPTGVPLTCGDGFLDSAEACDDGNLVDSDGCSMTCQTEEFAPIPEPSTALRLGLGLVGIAAMRRG